jgi:hypothetical protein
MIALPTFMRQAEHYCNEVTLCLVSQDGCSVVPLVSMAGPPWKCCDKLLKNVVDASNQYSRIKF